MVDFCSIDKRGTKKVSSVDRKKDVIASNQERSDEVIRNSIDERNDIVAGSYDVLSDNNIPQSERGNYSRYLKQKGVSRVAYLTSAPVVGASVVSNMLSRGFASPVFYSSVKSGNAIGIKISNPFVVELEDYQTKLDSIIFTALVNEHDSVIIKTSNSEIILPFKNDVIDVGTKQDIQEYREFVDTQLNTDGMDSDLISEMQNTEVAEPTKEKVSNDERIGIDFANKMSQQLGVEYEVVDEDRAIEITHGEPNEYKRGSNEPAFFYRGKVYFVKGKINANSVFHEFSHPVIRSIRNDNRALFEQLFNDVISTPEGQEIMQNVLQNTYMAQKENSDYMKEEVIAKALSKLNEDTLNDTDSVLNKIMYAIKQFLRKMFGKTIEIHKLKPSTTLKELADILNGGDKIYVDTSKMSDESFVVYDMINLTPMEEDAKNIGVDNLIDTINAVGNSMTRMLNTLQENGDFDEMGKIIGEDVMRSVVDTTTGYNQEGFKRHKEAYDKIERFKDSYSVEKDSAIAFVKTISSVESIMNDIDKALKQLKTSKDYRRSTLNAYYAKHIIDSWQSFIEKCDEECDDGEMKRMLERIISKMKSSNRVIKEYFADNTRAFVKEQLQQMAQYGEDYYADKIARMKKAGGSMVDRAMTDEFIKKTGMMPSEYDEFKQLYEQYKRGDLQHDGDGMSRFGILLKKYRHGYEINDMKIDLVAEALLGDATWLNSMVESYTSNQNLIGMSLANFIEQTYGEATNRSLDAIHDDYMRTEKFIKDAGLKDSDGSLRNTLCFQDEKLVYDYRDYEKQLEEEEKRLVNEPDKEAKLALWKKNHKPGMVRRKVWSFLNPFKNYQADYEESLNKVNEARNLFNRDNSDENYQKYIKARTEHEKFVNTYFNRKYVPQFYELDDEFSMQTWTDSNGVRHNLGAEVVTEYNRIIDEINSLNEILVTASEDASATIEELWKELRGLSLYVNADGSTKDEYGIAFADMMRKYKQAKQEFYDNTFNVQRFETAFNEFKENVLSQYKEDSNEYKQALNEWIAANCQMKPSEQYFTDRKNIIDEIDAICKNYQGEDVEKTQRTNFLWRIIEESVREHRDFDGEILYQEMTDTEIKAVTDAEDELFSDNEYTQIISTKELKRLNALEKQQILTESEQNEKRELQQKKIDNGRVLFLREKLKQMSSSVPSNVYMKELTQQVSNFSSDDIAQIQLTSGSVEFNSEAQVNEFLGNIELVRNLCGKYPEFDSWFKKNHIDVGNDKKIKFRPRYFCRMTQINTEEYPQYLSNDTNVQRITGVYGLTPNYCYFDRTVKDEYQTKLEVGVTVDNTGKFLPLTEEQMKHKRDRYDLIHGQGAFEKQTIYGSPVRVNRFKNNAYYELQKKNPKAFRALQELVKIHLKHQQDLDNGSKLYLEVARIRKDLYQGIAEGKPLETLLMKARNMVRIDEEDVYDGLVNYNKTSAICRSNWITGDAPQEPILGLFDIDADDCDFSIMFTNEQYYNDIFRHKALVQINPIVRSIQNVVNDMQVKNTGRVSASSSGKFDFEVEKRRGKTGVLQDFCNALIEREFDGKFRADNWGGRLEQLYVASYRYLTKRGSIAYFNIDIQSALKNFLGQKIQSLIEASGGIDFDIADFHKADGYAWKVIREMITNGYTNPVNSINLQLLRYFDMIPGNTRSTFGKEFANSYGRELIDGNTGTRLRKLSEMQATAQIGFAMLLHKKIKRNGNDIKYIDAFELIDNNLRLKSGIDKRYDVLPSEILVDNNTTKQSILKQLNIPESDSESVFANIELEKKIQVYNELTNNHNENIARIKSLDVSDERKQKMIEDENNSYNEALNKQCKITIDNIFFKTVRSSITETFEQLNGAYNDYSQPHMNQYLLMKPLLYLRKYYVSMFAHKYAFRDIYTENGRVFIAPRFNVRKQRFEMPVYGDALNTLYETILYHGQNINWMDNTQRANLIRFFTEMVIVGTILPIIGNLIMFGIDGDDDKYKSQRDKNKLIQSWSGTIFDKNFNFGGYMRQAALLQILKLQDEQSQFHPFLKGIQGAYNFGWKSGIVYTTVTVDNWMQSLRSLYGMLSDDINGVDKTDSQHYYTRDQGPYWWQKKGAPKFINYYMKSWGLNGSNIDPATSYKNFISYMNNMKR